MRFPLGADRSGRRQNKRGKDITRFKEPETTMRCTSHFLVHASIVAAITISTAAFAHAQEAEQDKETFAQRFWTYLQEANYKQWAPYPGQDLGFFEGQAPHGAFLKLYVNRKAAARQEDPPPGSIIIKENYGPDKEELMAITIMYRIEKEYDPQHNNWWWGKYTPDGQVATMNEMRLAGKVQSCIGCHSSAKGNDFVFTNDSSE